MRVFRFLFYSVVAVLIFLICAFFYYSPMLKPFPKSTGPYDVGTVSYHFIDSNRVEKHNKNKSRELMVKIWYPSDVDEKEQKLYPYLPKKISEIKKELQKDTGVSIPFWNVFLMGLQTYSIPVAAISNNKKAYPVIIFSHGLAGYSDVYSVYTADLASHGYVVVGINHTYGADLTVFPDGRVVHVDERLSDGKNLLNKEWVEYAIEENKQWQKDIQFVLADLKSINNKKNGKFYKKLDLEKVGVLGHSKGGIATVELCRNDKKFKGGVSLDGWNNDFNSTDGINTPFLFLFGGESVYSGQVIKPTSIALKNLKMSLEAYRMWGRRIRETAELFCANSGKNCHEVIIEGVGHEAFSDMILLKWPFGRILHMDVGSVEPYQTIAFIREKIRKFFDSYVGDVEV